MLQKKLENLWLTKEESHIYLTALRLGSSPASLIAKNAKIKRETAYYTLKKLIERGLMGSIIKNGITFFIAENPEKIIYNLKRDITLANSLLPELKALSHSSAKKFKLKFYEGEEWVKNILDMYLNTSMKEALVYTNLGLFLTTYGEEYVRLFFQKKYKQGIATKLISSYSEEAKIFLESLTLLINDQILLVDQEEFIFENDVIIFDDTVIIVSLNPKEFYAIYIESNIFAATQKSIFNLAWLWGTSFITKY